MQKRLALVITFLVVGSSCAQDTLPPVREVEWKSFKAHTSDLLRALNNAKAPLSDAGAVQQLLDAPGKDTEEATLKIQKILDSHCLIAVHINPESRVKAARGPVSSELTKEKPTVFLVRIHNEAEITQALQVSGTELLTERNKTGWLQAKLLDVEPLPKSLSGQRLEYRLLWLVPIESGKREATLKFDAGQGTQDLGFRAEVPILFRVR